MPGVRLIHSPCRPQYSSATHHVDHGAAADGGGARLAQVVCLQQQSDAGRQTDPLAVDEAEQLRVVEHRVEVLDPERVDGPVEHQPAPVGRRRVAGVGRRRRPLGRRRDGRLGRRTRLTHGRTDGDMLAVLILFCPRQPFSELFLPGNYFWKNFFLL